MDFVIEPAASKCGYIATRADQIAEPGRISEQIFSRVLSSDACIAVLTFGNPNVYYELAVAHCFGIPTVLLIDANDSLPFDVKDMRVVFYDVTDPRRVRDGRDSDEVAAQLRAIDASSEPPLSPVSVAIDIQQLKSSQFTTESDSLKTLIQWMDRIDGRIERLLGQSGQATLGGTGRHQEYIKKCLDPAIKTIASSAQVDELTTLIRAINSELRLNDVMSNNTRSRLLRARGILENARSQRERASVLPCETRGQPPMLDS